MGFIEKDVRWGIIGCGDVCEVKSGPALYKAPNSQLIAVMRRDISKAQDFASRHGAMRAYADAGELVNDPEVNAIYIATPPAFHEEYALLCMQSGKPVYIEKPITINSESCERMITASKKYNVPAVCAHYRRGLSLFKRVRSLVQEGALGTVRLISLQLLQSPHKNVITQTDDNWRVNPALSGGGLFHDLSPHQLDIMYWIFGAPSDIHGRSLIQGNPQGVPEVTSLEALFGGDILFQGVWSFNVDASAVKDTCTILGENGYVSFSFFGNPDLEISIHGEKKTERHEFPPHIQQPMIEQVIRYFRGEGENPCSLEESLVTMRMMDATLVL